MIQRTQPYLTGLAHLRLHVIFFQGILRTRDETLLKKYYRKRHGISRHYLAGSTTKIPELICEWWWFQNEMLSILKFCLICFLWENSFLFSFSIYLNEFCHLRWEIILNLLFLVLVSLTMTSKVSCCVYKYRLLTTDPNRKIQIVLVSKAMI